MRLRRIILPKPIFKNPTRADRLPATTYGGSDPDWAYSIQQTFDQDGNPDGYIVGGYYTSDADNPDSWVLKLASDGDVTWEKTYGGIGTDTAHSVQQTSDGGFIVAGSTTTSFGAGGYDLMVLKLDSNGEIPSCTAMSTSIASVSGTIASIEETNVVPQVSSASLNDTGILSSISSATATVVCGLKNKPPDANAGADQTVILGETVTFDGSGSSDLDGTIVSYVWDFGDGDTGSGVAPSHSYELAGIYEVTLSVTDDDGAPNTNTDTNSIVVTVVQTPGQAAQELISVTKNLSLPGGTKNSLLSKLESTINSLDKGQENAAINKLDAFINQVEAQRGKKITDEEIEGG